MSNPIKQIKRFSLIAIMPSFLVLSGCASLQAPPHCPDSRGLACARVDQINRLVNHNRLTPLPTAMVNTKEFVNPYFSQHHSKASLSPTPNWHSESVMQIWLAPYIDRSGNYHQASMIDTVVKAGYWVGHPIVALKK